MDFSHFGFFQWIVWFANIYLSRFLDFRSYWICEPNIEATTVTFETYLLLVDSQVWTETIWFESTNWLSSYVLIRVSPLGCIRSDFLKHNSSFISSYSFVNVDCFAFFSKSLTLKLDLLLKISDLAQQKCSNQNWQNFVGYFLTQLFITSCKLVIYWSRYLVLRRTSLISRREKW